MSELINTTDRRNDLYGHLLSTVSAAALVAVLSAPQANAETGDRPNVWLELGGQLETVQGREDIYAPPFILRNLDMPLNAVSPTTAQHPPLHAFDGEGKLLFQPSNTGWVFSAAVRFGRSNGKKTLHQQTHTSFVAKSNKYSIYHKFLHITPSRFNHSETKNSETHVIADFVAGKDVGLGLVGRSGSSILNFGVRMAQFTRRSDVIFRSQPDAYYPTKGHAQQTIGMVVNKHHHSYYAHEWSGRSFHGIGPSLSWEGSAPFLGHPDEGELTFDWSANGAVLFGRQRMQGGHMVSGHYLRVNVVVSHYTHTVPPIERSRSVIVPNVGGMAGISVKYPNAKFSLGYRADFFFNAMDQGLDTRDTKTQGFFGPYINFAVGL